MSIKALLLGTQVVAAAGASGAAAAGAKATAAASGAAAAAGAKATAAASGAAAAAGAKATAAASGAAVAAGAKATAAASGAAALAAQAAGAASSAADAASTAAQAAGAASSAADAVATSAQAAAAATSAADAVATAAQHASGPAGSSFISLFGIAAVLGIAVMLSTDRKAIKWRLVAWGLGIQFLMALFILKTAPGKWLFLQLGAGITHLLDFAKVGSGFIFGNMVTKMDTFGFVFAVQVLPTIIFMASLISIFYYLGVVQKVVQGAAWLMQRTLGASGAESLSAAACVFVGQVEGPLLVRPYIASMTKSELMALMTGGMATIAGGVMAAYIGMLGADWAPHLLAASLMGAPGGLVLAKIIVPETEVSVTQGTVKMNVEIKESSIIEAAAKGASDGMHLAFSVMAMLIAFISLVALANAGIGMAGGVFGMPTLSLEMMLGWIFSPLAFLLGVPWADAAFVGNLIGKKLVLNEFVSYAALKDAIAHGQIHERSAMIATFALCGFANFSSIAQNVGGVGAMAPERRGDLARLGVRAMCAGALASCMSAAIAGLLG